MVHYCSDLDYHIRAHRAGIRLLNSHVKFYHERSSTIRNANPFEREVIQRQADADRERFREKWGVEAGGRLLKPVRRGSQVKHLLVFAGIALMIVVAWTLIGTATVYNRWRWEVFDEGATRASIFVSRYHNCTGNVPPPDTVLNGVRFVNNYWQTDCRTVVWMGTVPEHK